ncbi:PPC domain-containing protein [Blastopirellula marina]|uniref:Peptidase n=1 Tax=Blastopirellula marina TaxID=124 RepID=A0A2S8F4J3_9BACT|nr:PPC domain-containing protein [Blastopirellula marina]PQO27060.1 peptidase [Blastopirellula marina]PTL41207.1 peptidase [Blastopirellula marina]
MKRFHLLGLAVITTLLVSVAASAAEPNLQRLDPPGFQRGTEIEVVLRGDRIADAEEVMFYEPGVTMKSLEKVDAKQAKVVLNVAPDCRLGQHALRLRTASGISDVNLFYVGALPEVNEKEPNNDFKEPQPIEMGTTVNGVVQNEDVDYFVVEAKKGQRISAELAGLRLGLTFFDPYLAILNEQRFELAKSDDEPLLFQDCVCSLIAPEDGKYIVQVRESSYGGNGNCVYRLSVGSFPRPLGIYPTGGKPGEEIDVTWLGDASGIQTAKVKLPETPGEFLYYPEDEYGIAPSPNRLFVSDLPTTVEVEPNANREQATPMAGPGMASGVIGEKGDEDYFKFPAKKDQEYDIRVYAREEIRSYLDPVVNVFQGSDGKHIQGNDDSNGNIDSYLRIKAPEDGDLVIRVRDHLNSGSPLNVYCVEVTQRTPSLTVEVPEVRQYVARTVSIPQGNTMAVLLSARRENFGGDLNFSFEDLPEGVEVTTFPMPANTNVLPVLLTAKPDAKLDGKLVDVIARPTNEDQKIEGHVKQRSMLVRGQNNRDMWGHNAKRLAVAVTEKVPFKLEIVQPKVPIVRDGSMQLKVIVTRDEGFDGEIRIRLLNDPPGIGASRSIKIEKGQNEALIPMTANGGAQVGTHKICVLGTAGYKAGSVEVATPFVDLVVEDRLVDFAFNKAAVEQGQETKVIVGLSPKRDFPGEATVQLLGLPAGTTAEPIKVTKDAEEAVFDVKVAKDAKDGKHASIVARITVTQNEEPIIQTNGNIELRIDKPLPPKVAAAAPPKAEAKKEAPKPAPEKPLTRLEQLRLAKEQGN